MDVAAPDLKERDRKRKHEQHGTGQHEEGHHQQRCPEAEEHAPRQIEYWAQTLEECRRIEVCAKVAGIARVRRGDANGTPIRMSVLPRAHAAGIEVTASDHRE